MSAKAVREEAGRPSSVEHVKTWTAIAASVAVTVVALGGGIHWAVTSAVEPLVERLGRVETQLEKMDTKLDNMDTRLTRVETLLDERLPAAK
ncbi:MAG: hypothetical protein OXC95_02150 [Dehalococcoidia bacterium]|nr:hypothetical protein [Dehalococcoidia bacterium]